MELPGSALKLRLVQAYDDVLSSEEYISLTRFAINEINIREKVHGPHRDLSCILIAYYDWQKPKDKF